MISVTLEMIEVLKIILFFISAAGSPAKKEEDVDCSPRSLHFPTI